MANAPISIGELANVPAPLSPIQSAWAQDVTKRIVHRFANVAQRAALYPAPLQGALSIAMDRGWLEMWDGVSEWKPVGGGGPDLIPTISAPAGTGNGGSLRPGETSRLARYTIPRPAVARVWHTVLLGGTAAWAARLSVTVISPQSTIFFEDVGSPAVGVVATGRIVGVTINGLGQGTIVDLLVTHLASSGGELAWYLDGLNNAGRMELR